VSPAGAAGSVACPGDDRATTGLEGAAALVCDINVLRGRQGLRPLRWSWPLRLSAQDLASDMAAHQFVSHVSSDGRTIWDRVVEAGYTRDAPAPVILENGDWGSYPYSSPLATAFGWLESPAHREHMLDPDMEDIGIGIAEGPMRSGGADGYFYVADFGTRGDDGSGARLLSSATTVPTSGAAAAPHRTETAVARAHRRRCSPHTRKHARKRTHHRRACRRR
jgi:uncharacterized protein YkwD